MATFYIATNGVNDSSRDGSVGQEWATLSYACSRVTTFGDVIHVNAGSYNETAQCTLAPGVSIEGSGRTTTTITATSTLTNLVYGSSVAGTDGRQSISNITFNCNLNVTSGICIIGRSNVQIVNCGIQNALDFGLIFADISGRTSTTEPTHWATGNIIRDNYFVNCGGDSWNSGNSSWVACAAIEISGQDGILIQGNDINNKTGNRYGYGIKGLSFGGYHKGIKILYNKIRTNIRDNVGEQSFGFNIELWTGVGGIEIIGNDLNGAIDMGGYGYWDDYSYGFAMSVCDNILIQDSRPTNHSRTGLILESGARDGCYFYNNWVENFSTGFSLGNTSASLVQGYNDVWVYYNTFCNIGYMSGGSGAGFAGYSYSGSVTNRNIYVLNNTIHKVNSSSGWGINIEYSNTNTWVNINIKNNIIYNAYTPIQFRNQTITSMYIHNNLTYGATRTIGHTDSWVNSTITLRELLNNQENVDPLFTTPGTHFTITSSSPCINAGVNVGLTEDFNYRSITGLPDIGSHEYISGNIYYVSTNGINDSARNGGVGQEWATLSYACSRVTTPNSVIFVNPGVYNETQRSILSEGVSIVGRGILSSIVSTYTHSDSFQASTIALNSNTAGSNGNQNISKLKFDGSSMSAKSAIQVYHRSNVTVNNCIFSNFAEWAIKFRGNSDDVIYSENNIISNNIIFDCGGPNVSHGNICIGGQTNMHIHGNNVYQPQRSGFNQSGFPIKFSVPRVLRGLKIYNNVLELEQGDEYDEWHFAIELFGIQGGCEIYNNRIKGTIDFSNYENEEGINDLGNYGYAVRIYDNIFGDTNNVNYESYGVVVERSVKNGFYVYNNHFRNIMTAIGMTNGSNQMAWQDIIIHNNIIENIGRTDTSGGGGIYIGRLSNSVEQHITNVRILNNVIYDNSTTSPTFGIQFAGGTLSTLDDVIIANNIIKGFRAGYAAGIMFRNVNGINVTITNNDIHDCDYRLNPYMSNSTISNLILTNNIESDPLFVSTSDFHLQSTSPCINAGCLINIIPRNDYEGNAVYAGSAPDIGAYETNSNNVYYLSPTGSDQLGTGAEGNPWFTIERAWSELVAGDIVYMRGGKYYYNKTQNLRAVSGTSDNYTRLWNYPDERPIIRPAVGWVYDGWYYGIYFQNLSSIHVLGLDVCYFTYQQTSCCRGIMAQNVSNSIFENLACYRNELGMMVTGNSGGNYIINCDFYENYDPYSNPPYNNGDGLDVSTIPQGYNNTINFCRAWYNADDGFDFFNNEGIITMNGCWTWMNGYQEDHESFNQPPMIGNDGNGFKLGQAQNAVSTTRRYLYNCIAALNRVNNFSQNTLDPQILTCELYNCLSYGSIQRGYQFNWAAEGSTNSILRNNIAYLNNAHLSNWITNDHNTWNTGFSVSSSDFVSLDDTQLIAPRNIDGSLPYITFGRLSANSPLIDAGVDIGRPYYGIAPDIGAFEAAPLYGAVAENIHVSRVGIV